MRLATKKLGHVPFNPNSVLEMTHASNIANCNIRYSVWVKWRAHSCFQGIRHRNLPSPPGGWRFRPDKFITYASMTDWNYDHTVCWKCTWHKIVIWRRFTWSVKVRLEINAHLLTLIKWWTLPKNRKTTGWNGLSFSPFCLYTGTFFWSGFFILRNHHFSPHWRCLKTSTWC